MRKLKVFLAVLLASLSLHIYPSEIDSLLRELDMSIRNRPQYTLKRQEQIDALQRKLRLSHSDQSVMIFTANYSANIALTVWTRLYGWPISA